MATNMYVEKREAGDFSHLELPQWLKDEPFKVVHRPYCTAFIILRTLLVRETHKGGYINDWQMVGDVLQLAGRSRYFQS